VHRREYIHHLSIARGSLRELSTLLEIAVLLGMAEDTQRRSVEQACDHTGRMLTRMIAGLNRFDAKR
jgi:four helix bundle protein